MKLLLSDADGKPIETWEIALEPRDEVYDLSRPAACHALISEIREALEQQHVLVEQGCVSETPDT